MANKNSLFFCSHSAIYPRNNHKKCFLILFFLVGGAFFSLHLFIAYFKFQTFDIISHFGHFSSSVVKCRIFFFLFTLGVFFMRCVSDVKRNECVEISWHKGIKRGTYEYGPLRKLSKNKMCYVQLKVHSQAQNISLALEIVRMKTMKMWKGGGEVKNRHKQNFIYILHFGSTNVRTYVYNQAI